MTENAVENPVCPACGALVRPHALFCYNCGSAVPPVEDKAEDAPTPQPEEMKSAPRRGDGGGGGNENKVETLTPIAVMDADAGDEPVGKPTTKLVVADKPENDSAPLPPVMTPTETKLKSAASLRRGGRAPVQKKTVEVIWDEPENAPNVWFLVAAFVLALFAVGILLAMLYIR